MMMKYYFFSYGGDLSYKIDVDALEQMDCTIVWYSKDQMSRLGKLASFVGEEFVVVQQLDVVLFECFSYS